MKIISLTNGLFALVDDEDFNRVNQFKWYANITGNGTRIYARRSINGDSKKKSIYMHRFIMNCPDDMETDHQDKLTLNNQKSNLKNVTKKLNLANRNFEKRV